MFSSDVYLAGFAGFEFLILESFWLICNELSLFKAYWFKFLLHPLEIYLWYRVDVSVDNDMAQSVKVVPVVLEPSLPDGGFPGLH